ncbi:lysoplasmalogenase [Diaphorobacter sp.]|uniref:lysoplasmalogenase n=1 Tax=Diaphorobacter sp. TaxID=1934310 RepID=UPI00258B4156|nr:lysoplasmalogenase [Diaphorobacter sp.]
MHALPVPTHPLLRPFSAMQAVLLLAALTALAVQPPAALPLWVAAWLTAAWALWALLRGRIGMLLALVVQCGALATVTSATGLLQWHWLFKPLTMVIAIILVAIGAYESEARALFDSKSWWLLGAALMGSLAGDAFLMVEGFFIPGLVSFLLAHVAYIVLFRQGVAWLPRPGALAATLGVGGAMYAYLWHGGLPAELRIPVAVYVTVIALMAAQALGRASVLGNRAARQVALGACFFMLSDSLLATNRFVQPLPLAQVWVLATYYAAQAFIVHGMVVGLRRPQNTSV